MESQDRGIGEMIKFAGKIVKEEVPVRASSVSALETKAASVLESIKSVEHAASECAGCANKAVETVVAASEEIVKEVAGALDVSSMPSMVESMVNPAVESIQAIESAASSSVEAVIAATSFLL